MNISKFNQASLISAMLLTFMVNSPNVFSQKHIYECKDAKGSVLYTDHPKTDPNCFNPVPKKVEPARTINLKNGAAVKSITEPDVEELGGSAAPEDTSYNSDNNAIDTDQPNTKYSTVKITSPVNNESVNSCGGQYNVSFTSEPALASGDQAKLLIDGVAHGTPTTASSIQTNTLERGPHSAVVQIMNKGEVVGTSQPVNFMFMRNCAR